MASASAIAEMNSASTRDLTAAMTHLSTVLDVQPVPLLIYRGDPAYEAAARLKALAAWSQQVALTVMEKTGADTRNYRRVISQNAVDYSSADEETLRAEAVKRHIEGADQMARNDLALALRASDSERWSKMDEQYNRPETQPDYDAMTRAEAVKRAQEAGMPVAKNTTKAEAVDWLLAADGISEDEQAALDADEGGL